MVRRSASGIALQITKEDNVMASVTKRIEEIKQPYGGYIPLSKFKKIQLNDGKTLFDSENIHASVSGMAVDYMTRLVMGADADDAFYISLKGAKRASLLGQENSAKIADKLLSGIKGIDDKSIISACKLSTFDVWARNPAAAPMAKTADEINPDKNTILNIQTMVERSVDFWKEYGPITADGFTFEYDGYTPTVNSGDGDFLTYDTMWDFKVSKSKPTSKNTLQLLMYWIMGQHSGKEEFRGIKNIGIFNARLNMVYILQISEVSSEIIKEVERDVICYEN